MNSHSTSLRRVTVAIAASLMLLVACTSTDQPTAEQLQKMLEIHTESAQQYLAMGELERAQDQAQKGLEIDPENLKLRLITGWALQRRGRTNDILQAENVFRQLLGTGDYRANLGLGEALERKGMVCSEAADAIRSGDRVSEAADPSVRIAELEQDAKNAWSESHTELKRALERHPGDIDAIGGLIRVSALLGNDRESLDWCARHLEATTADLNFWQQRILRPDISAEEESYFRSLIKRLTHRQVATHLHAATLLVKSGDKAEAIGHLDVVAELDPERSEVFSRRAELALELGRYDQAIVDIDTFLRLCKKDFEHPDVKRAWRLRGEAEAKKRALLPTQ